MTPGAKAPDWVSEDGLVTLYCADCRECLPLAHDIACLHGDPPYGINAVKSGKCFSTSNAAATRNYAAIIGDDESFDPAPFLSFPKVCLWGANHYADKLPAKARWLIWDKRDGCQSNPLADCEMAWTNDSRPARLFHHQWMGMLRASERAEDRVHPAQKPVLLIQWALDVLEVGVGECVADLWMGSGTTGVACIRTGRKFIGVEIDEHYFNVAKERIIRELQSPQLPGLTPAPEHVAQELKGI